MKRGKGYCRYSTDNQTDNSIAYQMAAITKYCSENDIDLCGFFVDEAQSGTNTERRGFQELLLSANRGEFDAVIIYDITRGSRDNADWFNFRKAMMHLNIEVISATQKLGDINNPNDFLTELINIGLGQHQVLDTRQKSIAGTAERAKQGIFCGGHAPLGYDIVNGRYVINESEAEIVKIIFTMYANGKSYNNIIDALTNYRGKFGQHFGKNSLSSILQNERYIGVYTWNKQIRRVMRKWAGGKPNPNCVRLEGVIPPIVSMDIWEKVRARMKSHSKASNKAKREYLLSGLIECTTCGATYVGHCVVNKRKDGSLRETRYYYCGERYRTRSCDSKNLNADEIETFVVQQLKAYLLESDFDEVAQTFAEAIESASPDASTEKKELASICKKIDNGVNAILSGIDIPELKD